jgi:IS4 transposase
LYRRRFGIETSDRQLHQVKARTSSRNPALRLLLIGLALLIVNLWVLLRRSWVQMTRYGERVRVYLKRSQFEILKKPRVS